MHKAQLDRLLEKAVADALGVALPRRAVVARPHRATRTPRRELRQVRELHPA